MSAQIIFFKKSVVDIDYDVNITITDSVATNTGESIANYMRNRKNTTSWITTGSTDSGNTTLTVDWISERDIENVILVKHNFKSYTIQYWNGSTYVNFSTVINPTNDTNETTRHTFTEVSTSRIQIVVNSTQTVDAEKQMAQLIVCENLGQFEGWPVVGRPTLSQNRQITKMLSGKKNIVDSVGFFSCSLTVDNLKSDADLTLIENIYDRNEGVLLWLGGGDETQFSSIRQGWRKEDLFLVRPSNELTNEFVKGLYVTGVKVSIKLDEVIR